MKKIAFLVFILALSISAACTKKISASSLDGRALEGSINGGSGVFEKDVGSNFTITFSQNSFIIDGDLQNKGHFEYQQSGRNRALLTLKHHRNGGVIEVLNVNLSFIAPDSGSYHATLLQDGASTQQGNFRLK